MNLEQKIEGLLFWKGEPISTKKIAEILKVKEAEVTEALSNLNQEMKSRGLILIEADGKYTLGTNPQISDLIEQLRKEELDKKLSKASLETLSIILYKNGAGRGEIDYIRGVNSSFTIRALSVRGLIEKAPDPEDARKYIYKPTHDLLSFMGVGAVQDLPNFQNIQKQILNLEEEKKNTEKDND